MATRAKKPPKKREDATSKKPSKAVGASRAKQSGKSPPPKGTSPNKSAKAGKAGKAGKGKTKDVAEEFDSDMEEPRRLGVRGAAPWAARHAAKHAAEARARAADPPPPGSARATLRAPTGAEELKTRIIELHNALVEVKTLKKHLGRNFFAIGKLLHDICERKLYEARGFGSFETFLDREVDLGKTTSLRLARVVEVFQEEAALEYGMDRVLQALATLESGQRQGAGMQPNAIGSNPPPLPLRPPHFKK